MALPCKKIMFLLLTTILLSSFTLWNKHGRKISDYHRTFFPCYNKVGALRIALRTFYRDEKLYYLVVDPNTFITTIAPATNFKSRNPTETQAGFFTMQELQQTPYLRALQRYTSPPYKLENYGITHTEQPINGVILTVDMCPAEKTFETEFFNTLIKKAEQTHQAIPIAVSISGRWIVTHPDEFNWLGKQEKNKKLKIIWINHSYSHVFYADIPMNKNFLLLPETNMTQEILATEKLLLEHNQVPSVFFRFPGLISNEKLVLILRKYGLIPVSTDAWLAKDQTPSNSSIILVHGNSNEPEGIKKIMPLLQDSTYHWLPLTAAFANH